MISSTTAYQEAVVATTRRTKIGIVVDISDPDMVYTGIDAANQADISVPGQLIDKNIDTARYATLEVNRWILDGSSSIFEDDYTATGEIGGVSSVVCDDSAEFNDPPWFEVQFTNVAILQVCGVYFSSDDTDGIPTDFTVEIKNSGTTLYSATITDNTEQYVIIEGFRVYYPDAIRVTVTKWTTPNRRVRVTEIVPGAYERWSDNRVTGLDIEMTADPSNVTFPFGTCALTIDNTDRKFEPRNKSGLFQSLQERQKIQVSIGLLVNGVYDYKNVGTYYQYNGGWKTSDNDTTIRWNLVDILGLLAEREYVPPSTLPVTVTEWVESILSHLGTNFTDRHTIDETFAEMELYTETEYVVGIKCADMIRFICQVCGGWARADATTGNLAIEPLWSQGNALDLNNMERYPTIQANEDVAQVIFTFVDYDNYQIPITGNSISASKSVSVQNPFVSIANAQEQAMAISRNIIAQYGGNVYHTTGRGNPTTELGDVVTLALDESVATTGRVWSQTFSYSRQVLSGCTVDLVQSNGLLTFTDRVEITEPCTWTVPAGVDVIRVICVGGGSGGTAGKRGTFESSGDYGVDGVGGKVWWDNIIVTPLTSFVVTIGAGGASGGFAGSPSTFGQFTSAAGVVCSPAYTDIVSGNAYGRTGVKSPLAHTGDGGQGGKGGRKGQRHEETYKDANGFTHTKTVTDRRPTEGEPGVAGASGCVIVYYNSPEEV